MKCRLPRYNLTLGIVLGLILGLIVGLFFGEPTASLEPIGSGFIRMLQMTILPYIMVSLIVGFGSMDMNQAAQLAKKAGMWLLIFLALSLTIVLSFAQAFPDRLSASFFNPSSLEPEAPLSIVDLFIPSNPFEALASSSIPAVVFFSIMLGLALMKVEGKQKLLDILSVASKGLTGMTMLVVKCTPIGVFALTASAAGTMGANELMELQVYFITYTAACLLVTFVIFPAIVSSLTPFTYKKIISLSHEALFTGFTTGNLFVVLPLITENCKKMIREHASNKEEADSYVDVIIPVMFNFPNMGKLIALLFVLFGAWYTGNTVPISDYPSFSAIGLITFFGGIDIALPFMLQVQNLPQELFNLYAVAGVINGRFATLLACMDLTCITVLASASLVGLIKIKLHRIVICLVISAVSIIVVVGALRYSLAKLLDSPYNLHKTVLERTIEKPVPYELTTLAEIIEKKKKPQKSRRPFFESWESGDVMDRQVLRVGYIEDSLPFSYRNSKGDLVGFDIEMAHKLAKDMECGITFVPIESSDLESVIKENHVDIIMSHIPVMQDLLDKLNYSEPYLQLTLSLLVPKTQQQQFETVENIRRIKDFTVYYTRPSSFFARIKAALPKVKLKEIDSPKEYFKADKPANSALLIDAESGSSWSVLNPEYTIVVPKNAIQRYGIAYPLSTTSRRFQRYLNSWLELQKTNKSISEMYDYWILGKARTKKEARWSIMHNVLGWSAKKDD